MKKTTSWQAVDLSSLLGKLQEAKQLLEQAAALSAARDGEQLRAVSELQRRNTEQERAHTHQRRYR